MVVCDKCFKVQLDFFVQRIKNKFPNYYKTIYGLGRSECSSCRALTKNRGALENNVSILRFSYLR